MSKKKPVLYINPPPQDRRCECCGKHISELKPFGGKGDPLVGDFTGSFLVKNFRSMATRGKIDEIWDTEGMWLQGKKLTKKEKKEYDTLRKKQEVPERNYKGKIMEGCYRINIDLLTKEEQARFKKLENKHYKSHKHLDEKKFIKKYGKKELDSYYFQDQLENTVEASWECRDCMCLYGDGFYNKRDETWRRREYENARKEKN